MKLKFDPYDCVIVQSIFFGQGWFRRGATLQKIVTLTDALDRTTPSYDQITDILPKLLTANLVRISHDKIYLTKKYRQLRRASMKSHPKFEHETDRINVILAHIETQDFEKMVSHILPEWKWQIALNNYLNALR